MNGVLCGLFRASLYLFPRDFRRLFAQEMAEIFSRRIRALPLLRATGMTLLEVSDVAFAAVRVRIEDLPPIRPALAGGLGVAVLATLLTLDAAGWKGARPIVAQSDSVEFNAHDPAGEFTLTIRRGRPVAASIDRQPVPATRLVQRGDSIRFLAPGGGVVLTVAYYRESARIEWQARPQSCRGQAADCVRYQ